LRFGRKFAILVIMDHELIQTWLQLPPGPWPPDHYTLLGIDPAERDLSRIEQQVHVRMERLRTYQLTHPELATEAMNCLAQALVCLCDPQARTVYDQKLSSAKADPNGEPAPSAAALFPEAALPPTAGQTFSDWQTAPPPLRLLRDLSWPASLEAMSKETVDNLALPGLKGQDTATDAPAVFPPEGGTDPSSVSLAGSALGEELLGKFSRRGLRSRRVLYYQIARTRQLLCAWEQVGKYLNRPTRLVSHPTEATDLIGHMGVIRDLLPSAMPPLGEAGQPGYLVLALARQQLIVPMLQTLLPSQREALARDWQAGHAVLRSARLFLRQELRTARRRRGWRRALRLISAGLRDHPGTVLFLLAWVAVNLSYWPVLAPYLPQQLICLLGLAAIGLALWLYHYQPVRRSPMPRLERKSLKKRPRARRRPDSSRV
jgi:hypothetical protein